MEQIKMYIEDLKKGMAELIECPRCNNTTFIGLGQGFTHDDRPYPIGECVQCMDELDELDDSKFIELNVRTDLNMP